MQRVALVLLASASLQAAAQVPIRTIAVDGDATGAGVAFTQVGDPVAGSGGVACVEEGFGDGLSCTTASGLLEAVLWAGDVIEGLTVADIGDGLTTPDVVLGDGTDVAFIVQLFGSDAIVRFGVAQRRAGIVSLAAKPGGPAAGGGTFSGDASELRMNGAGSFTFVDGGRLFLSVGGVVTRLVAPGDPLPGGGVFAGGTRGLIDDTGNVFVNGCTSDFNWLGGAAEPVGRCATVRLDADGDRSALLGTLDAPLGRTGFIASALPVAVARNGAAAAFAQVYDEAVGAVNELVRVDAVGTGLSDLSADDAPFGTSGQNAGVLLDDGTFLYVEFLPDAVNGGNAAAIVRLDGATTVVLQVGDAAPVGGTFTLLERIALAPTGEYAVLARTSTTGAASVLFMTRAGGAPEKVIGEGESLQIRAGDARTIQTLSLLSPAGLGAPSSIGRDGTVAFTASFVGGARGAFLAGLTPVAERPNLKTEVTVVEGAARQHARTTWRVVVENTGTSDAEDVVVDVAFDFDLREPSAPGFFSECTPVGDGILDGTVIGATCTVGTLGPGQSHQLELPTLPSQLGLATTTATPVQSTLDADPADDVGTLALEVAAPLSDLGIFVDERGATITNNGPSGAEVVRVTGTLDVDVATVTMDAGGACVVEADRRAFLCARPAFLREGASFPVRLALASDPGGARSGTLTMSVEGDAEDPQLGNNQGSAEVPVPDLAAGEIDAGCDCSGSDGPFGSIAGGLALLCVAGAMRRRPRG